MRVLIFLLASSVLFGAPSYKRSITIDHTKVAATLTDFPVLVSRTDAALKTVANGGNVTDDQGDDILFWSDSALTSALTWQVELYVPTTGQLVAWVKIASLSSTVDTVIYMSYGDTSVTTFQSTATAVWDANYKGVWHLGDGDSTAAGFYKDSTSNAKHGTLTDTNGDVAQVAGQIGNALDFAGTASNIDLITTTLTDALTDLTVCVWYKDVDATAPGRERLLDKDYAAGFWIGRNLNAADSFGGGIQATGDPYGIFVTLADNAWHYLCSVRSGTNQTMNGDGGTVTATATVSGAATGTQALVIGSAAGGPATDAIIDEVRVSNTARSSQWIATEYASMSSPGTFFALGSETPVGGGATSVRHRVVMQ